MNRIVTGTVPNNDKVLAACMPKAFQDFSTLPMPGISIGIPRHPEIFGVDAEETHGKTHDAKDWDEYSSSAFCTAPPPLPKVAQSLNHDGINDAGQGSKIMRLVPGLNRYPSESNDRGDEKELHATITSNTRQGEQREWQYRAKKKPPQSRQLGPFLLANPRRVRVLRYLDTSQSA